MIKESSAHGHQTIFPAVLIAAVVSLAVVAIADVQNQKFQFGVGRWRFKPVGVINSRVLLRAFDQDN
jgi:hypothetical protein